MSDRPEARDDTETDQTEPATLEYIAGMAIVVIGTFGFIGALWYLDLGIISERAIRAGALASLTGTVLMIVTDEHIKESVRRYVR